LIIGGTGTLGQAILKHIDDNFTNTAVAVFSRGELKQKELEVEYGDDIQYFIGDIRDHDAVYNAIDCFEPDIVFHVAALKHVDKMEHNVMECIKTNVLGTENVLDCCLSNHVSFLVFSSTDKAVLPVNAYGMSKALSEKLLLDSRRKQDKTHISIYRWGNVVGSRGSFINRIFNCLSIDSPVPITHPEMTRFWINIDTAVDYMFDSYQDRSDVFIPRHLMKAAKIVDVVAACAEIMGKEPKLYTMGIRDGEKIHECLYSSHDECYRSDTCEQYTREELIDLVRPIYEKGAYYWK
jgi:UDP-N-acetylglucosamine 4,6-dehydratase